MTPAPAPNYRPRPLPAPVVSQLGPDRYRILRASRESLENLLKGH